MKMKHYRSEWLLMRKIEGTYLAISKSFHD
jgi:hypothetical protein